MLIGLLGVALWNPSLPGPPRPVNAIVALDESASMTPRLPALATRLRGLLRTLPPDGTCTLMRFGANTAVESGPLPLNAEPIRSVLDGGTWPHRQAVDSSATDIERAVDRGLQLGLAAHRNVIILASDLAQNRGDDERALRLARRAGVPVYWLAPARTALLDGAITDLHVPQNVPAGGRLAVDVTVRAERKAAGRMRLDIDGKTYDRAPVTLPAGRQVTLSYRLRLYRPGAHRVRAHLELPGDVVPANNDAAAAVTVDGIPSILYVAQGPPPALFRSLRKGGRNVELLTPRTFAGRARNPLQASSIVLDDIAVDDMPPSAWDALIRRVEDDGTGLVVLGGNHSFGAGGYRHSPLERILPVTAEGGSPRGLAVLFLVDKSGSMEGDTTGISRLALARRAVIDTARLLGPGSEVGLIAFDARPSQVLPLAEYRDPERALDGAWRLSPSGGTRLLPALNLGVKQLVDSRAARRVLVLVSDGFTERADFTGLERRIDDGGVDVIALAVGRNAALGELRRLAALNHGRLLRVADAAALPRVMGRAVAQRIAAVHRGTIRPRVETPLPFAGADFPVLSGYMVTRARKSAVTYLASPLGDPLLASHFAGAGRVTALPAGLGRWAAHWPGWTGWAGFAGGLLDWNGGTGTDPMLHVSTQTRGGRLTVTADEISPAGRWLDGDQARMTLLDPGRRHTTVVLQQSAPGRYTADVPLPREGQYLINLRVGTHQARRAVIYDPTEEFLAPAAPRNRTKNMVRDGLLIPVAGDTLSLSQGPRARLPVRPWVLSAVLLGYALLLIYERAGARLRRLPDRGHTS